MEWKKTKLGTIATVCTMIGAFISYVFQAKDERIAKETAAVRIVSDTQVPVTLELSTKDWLGTVVYLDGKKIPADAYGMATFTLADWQANPSLLGDHPMVAEDFPVVAFYNSSAFDGTGTFLVVRRAADGELLSSITDRPPQPVRKVYPRREGGYNVVFADGSLKAVPLADWYRTYQGLESEPSVAEPTPTGTIPSIQELKELLKLPKKAH